MPLRLLGQRGAFATRSFENMSNEHSSRGNGNLEETPYDADCPSLSNTLQKKRSYPSIIDDVRTFAEAGLRESLFLSSGLCSPKRSTRRTKDIVDVSHKFKIGCSPPKFLESREETDCHRIRQRQKQIDYGKNTIGYERYIALVPREQRKIPDPQTPDVRQLCSKRRWDGLVQQWRRTLHKFDPPEDIEELNNKSFESRSANQYGCYKTEGTGKSTNSCSRRKGTMNLLQKYQKWIASKNSDKNTRH